MQAMVAKIDPNNKTMIVITKDKQFKSLPLPNPIPVVGTTISIEEKPQGLTLFKPAAKWLVAASVLVAVSLGIMNYGISPVSAYVTLDMKPSIQLAVDKQGRIKDIEALNEDGKKLIAQLKLDNDDIYGAVTEVLAQASKAGYLAKDSENLVMANITNVGADATIDQHKLQTVMHRHLSEEHYPGYVVVSHGDEATWRARVNMMEEKQLEVPALFPEESQKVTWEQPSQATAPAPESKTMPTPGHQETKHSSVPTPAPQTKQRQEQMQQEPVKQEKHTEGPRHTGSGEREGAHR